MGPDEARHELHIRRPQSEWSRSADVFVSDNVNQLARLTERQREVAMLASQGLSNREIAEKLRLAEGTVKIHLHMIYEKLDVRSRNDLIVRLNN